MAMTVSEKILSHAAGLDEVHAGQLIMAKLDMVLGNDITSPVAIGEFSKFNTDRVFDKNNLRASASKIVIAITRTPLRTLGCAGR